MRAVGADRPLARALAEQPGHCCVVQGGVLFATEAKSAYGGAACGKGCTQPVPRAAPAAPPGPPRRGAALTAADDRGQDGAADDAGCDLLTAAGIVHLVPDLVLCIRQRGLNARKRRRRRAGGIVGCSWGSWGRAGGRSTAAVGGRQHRSVCGRQRRRGLLHEPAPQQRAAAARGPWDAAGVCACVLCGAKNHDGCCMPAARLLGCWREVEKLPASCCLTPAPARTLPCRLGTKQQRQARYRCKRQPSSRCHL